jgi:hypothetical protein
MPSFVGLHNRVYVAHLDLSGLANRVSFGPLAREMKTTATFNDGGYNTVIPGLISGACEIGGNQDFAVDVLDDDISIGQIGSQYPVTVMPNPTGTVAAGDACWIARGVVGKLDPLAGAKGDVAGFTLSLAYDSAVVQAKVAHPHAARTTSGNGTAVALTGPTASQALYAALHVTAYSGLTNVVFKVQSDDNSGFLSPTDRITFSTVTGRTHEWKSVAGPFSSETYHRVTWTVTGSGSVSFTVAFGVI